MVRNLSLSPVEEKSGVRPRIVSRSARGEIKRLVRSEVYVVPAGPVVGDVDGLLSESGGRETRCD